MKNTFIVIQFLCASSIMFLGFYPIDGYDRTKIARLKYLQKQVEKGEKITRIPSGALHATASVVLNLKDSKGKMVEDFFVEDTEFSDQIKKVIPSGSYSLTALDMSDPNNLEIRRIQRKYWISTGKCRKAGCIDCFVYRIG